MCKEFNEKGSSETIRKATFCFNDVEKHTCSDIKMGKIPKEFFEWFCGFTEGDGSFIVSKTGSSERPFFVITQKKCRALRYIRKTIGFGSIKKYNGYFRYVVSSQKQIHCLISIFNGNLLCSKTQKRFQSWLDLYKIPQKSNVDTSKVQYLQTNWLAGFIDAEGCFSSYFARDKRYKLGYRLRFIFTLDQKEELVLKSIANAIGSGSVYHRKECEGMFRYALWGKKAQKKVVDYLAKFPLQSDKILSFKRWSLLHTISTKPKGLEKLSQGRLFRRVLSLQKVEDRVRP